jgi:hypothetical protein
VAEFIGGYDDTLPSKWFLHGKLRENKRGGYDEIRILKQVELGFDPFKDSSILV